MERKRSAGSVPGQHPSGAAPGTPLADDECWDSVSYLESAFHHGFMKLRLRNTEFVYHENARLVQELDEFCDVDTMHTAKGPVILLGDSGVGKSAFLANWLARRKKMAQNWQSSYPEFIFTHVVGCSRQSCQVSSLLERVLHEMKDYFELTKEVPDVEERLSWQFPKFLEAAAKKGRVILVVDGLQRLRTNDGESILKWVPLAFPPNVRVIFTGTVNYPPSKFAKTEEGPIGDHYEKTSQSAQMIERIKLEASRRHWKLVHVPALTEDDRRRIIRKFVFKNRPQPTVGGKPKSAGATDRGEPVSPGLQLFEIQQKAIVSVPMSTNAHFMKVFLMSMLWAVNEGFNIHVVFENWLNSDSVGQLLEAIMRSMELGHTPTDEATADAQQFLAETAKASAILGSEKRASAPHVPPFDVDKVSHDDKPPSLLPNKSLASMNSTDRSAGDGNSRPASRSRDRDGSATDEDTVIEFKVSNEQRPGRAMIRNDSVHETHEAFVNTSGRAGTLQSRQSLSSDRSSELSFSPDTPAILEKSRSGLASPSKVSGNSSSKHAAKDDVPSSELPPYLTGGKYVAPLGSLLGKALSLLYVSRHGMLQQELRFILNAMVHEANEQQKLGRVAPMDGIMERRSSIKQALSAFTETEWKALLRAIKPMGVLCVQDVIVLPICKDILRDVIWWRYIGSERVEQHYHQWLIRFFRIHPTTFRRVEELPWHLQRCYEWDALRSVLVNLPMFQLLYTANYKRELFGYWRKLSQGPLLSYQASESSLDAPVYVTTFDLVKEYGKSLEDWYRTARPPTKTFLPMVQLVTKFMYDFCVFYQGYLPTFQHAPFDLKRLYQDGFKFAEDLPHVHYLSGPNALGVVASAASSSSPMEAAASSPGAAASPGGLSAMTTSASAAMAMVAAIDAFPVLGRATAQSVAGAVTPGRDKIVGGNIFYYYQRWIWIQFPWLALSKEIVIRNPVVSNPKALGGSDMWGAPPSLSSPSYLGSNQLNAESAGNVMASALQDSVDGGASGGEGRNGDGTGGAMEGGASTTATASRARSGLFDARFWDVKKSMFDPGSQKLKGSMSASQLASVQLASVKAGPTPTTQTLDIISPENLFRKKATYAAVKNVLTSSVRRLPTAVAGASSVPNLQNPAAGDSSDNASKTFLTETAAATLMSACGFTSSPTNSEAFSLMSPTNEHGSDNNGSPTAKPSSLLASKDNVLDSLIAMEGNNNTTNNIASMSTAFGLPAHFQDYPQSEWDLKQSYNHRVVLKLQSLYDSVKADVARKKTHLESVKIKIKETSRRYDIAMRDCEMAKQATEEMTARADKLEQMIRNIDHQEKTRRKLLRGCELFPAYEPSHYDECKKELKLLQLTVKDLVEEKRVLLAKKTHLQTVELPALRAVIDKNMALLKAVVEKLERARDKIAHDQASADTLYQRRVEMIENVRSDAASSSETGDNSQGDDSTALDETLSRRTGSPPRAGSGGSGSTRPLAVKLALQRCETMCDKVQKATGFTKMESVYQKFARHEELNASFDEQAKVNEARLKQMKLTQSELEQQLHSLELSNAVASMEDPRALEKKLRDAEVELARTEYTQTNLLTTSKEVIAGAARLVKLLGITSCTSPLTKVIPAAKLWPPPAGYEGQGRLTSEFDSLGTTAIANLLQICLERATLMVDTVRWSLNSCVCVIG